MDGYNPPPPLDTFFYAIMQQFLSFSTKVLKILKTHPFVTLLYLTTLILSYLFCYSLVYLILFPYLCR